MNARFDEEPKRKRLKQSSIEESFKRHRSSLKSKVSLHLPDKKETFLQQKMQYSASPSDSFNVQDDEIRKKRALLADAAEKRRGSASNTACTSATSTASSDMVVEGGSKDGLSDNDDNLADFDDSPLLFPDSPPPAPPPEEMPSIQTTERFVSGGSPLQSLNRIPSCSPPLPPIVAQPDHTVLVRPSQSTDFAEPPKPSHKNYRDKWDKNHVRMPCSRENLYPGQNHEKKVIQNRWELIEATLLGSITNSAELQDAILKYNAHYSKRWNFEALHSYFNEVLDASKRNEFFSQTLPAMVSLALRLATLCTQAIPLLKRQQNHSLTMSQEQAACLLANAFFCTFPRRNSYKHSEYSSFPDINFNRLFQGGKGGTNSVKTEKLQAIFHYFRRITREMPTGTVTFQRQMVKSSNMPEWEKCTALFGKLHVSTKGTIEDNGAGFLQVDFANKYIGGGVIGEGCVQEEIRFLICPELILSRLFCERLDSNECLIITGAERYSDYVGYAHTFRWAGDHVDRTTRDSWGRRHSKIVAIDAHVFRCYTDQFQAGLLKRELDKAYCGFYSPVEQKYRPAIATGNWGCGAFGGDSRVKGLIQMMASSACSRDLVYFTFGDAELAEDLLNIHSFITERRLTVGAERYSDYVGYAHTFRWAGDHVDRTTRDSWGRRHSKIVAIDAHVFRCYTDQFQAGLLKRELDKAYCGFYSPVEQKYRPAIATGNWGCGAFGGDSRVKGLIQMMASSACSRDLVYFTFGDAELAEDLLNIHSFITERRLTVGDVWKMMYRYGKEIRAASSVTVKLYPYMRQLQDDYEDDTEDEQAAKKDESVATLSYNLDDDSESYKANTP